MSKAFDFTPKAVPAVRTRFRRITTPIPAPDSLEILETMRRHEPTNMLGQPPILWDRADGVQVYDAFGNMWLDWSSGRPRTAERGKEREIPLPQQIRSGTTP